MVGFIALAFCCILLGIAEGIVVVASIGIGEATGEGTGNGDNVSSSLVELFCCLEAEAAALASTTTLFLDEALPQVFTILSTKEEKHREKKDGGLVLRDKEEKNST